MESIDEDFIYNPYIAACAERSDAEQRLFFERFSRLPDETREFMTSIETTAQVRLLFEEGIAPDEYTLAIARIVGLIAMGDISTTSVHELLKKLNLQEPQATNVVRRIEKILEPLRSYAAQVATQKKLETALPPMTRPTESGPRPLVNPPVPPPPPGAQPPGRNILDLRNKPQT